MNRGRRFAKRVPTFLSLFSGCGGMDVGFVTAGFKSLAAYDIDADAVASYRRNFASPCDRVDLTEWERLLPTFPEVDVIVAGPPCQGFSLAGARRYDDPRNSLLTIPARIASRLPVRAVVIENVPGVLSESHRGYWNETDQILRNAGFQTSTVVIDAQSVGLPQTRKRVFLIALRGEAPPDIEVPRTMAVPLGDVLPVPDGTPNHSPLLLPRRTREYQIAVHIAPGQKLSNVRASVAAVHTWDIPQVFGAVTQAERSVLEYILRRRRQQRIRLVGDADPVAVRDLRTTFGPGVNRLITALVRKDYLRRRGVRAVDLTQTFNGKFRRLDPTKPTHCVLTRFCNPVYFLHPTEHRPLTVREAARIQGFGDDFVFEGAPAAQARQVGNAVPPPLAAVIAASLRHRM